MSYTKTARSTTTTTATKFNTNTTSNSNQSNNNTTTNNAYKASDRESVAFVMNAFPMRKLTNAAKIDYDDGWMTAYKAEKEKYFQAVLTNKKLDELEQDRSNRVKESATTPKRKILKNLNFLENEANNKQGIMDGFFLIQLCCVEDPLDIATVDISDKNLSHIKGEDMALFENITTINASENYLSLESFKCFTNLKCLSLNCNNIKSIRLKHGEFDHLENLDLSFNSLVPTDISHLGILKNLKVLKLTGNNLTYLPDTFSKQYVYTHDNKKMVWERFSNLEELYLDKNKLNEEDSFDVLSILKRLKKLYLNGNLISCIPKLKIFKKVHVVQEFSKSYYLRKSSKSAEKSSSAKASRRKSLESKMNEAMVKDLDRPSSEMNIHHSNILRNSFILEEEENDNEMNNNNNDDDHDHHHNKPTSYTNRATTSAAAAQSSMSPVQESVNEFEKKFELPFPELLYINLADNQLSEDDDLIGLAAWPSLNEIILYGNPIIYNNVGFTPLIKKYLIDRLGINIKRLRPLKPLKTQFLMPLREERVVDTKVSKVQKFPVEMRLLGIDQQSTSPKAVLPERTPIDRSNFSSAKSVGEQQPTTENPTSSLDSHDTVGHVNHPHEGKNKSSTFFMTQTDHDDYELGNEKSIMSPREKRSTVKKSEEQVALENKRIVEKYEVYKELLEIENEDQISIPKDLNASIRALKYTLDNPVMIRPPYRGDFHSLNNLSRSIRTIDTQTSKVPPATVPKIAQINDILDTLKERETKTEMQLNPNNATFNKHYREVQNKYQNIKSEFNLSQNIN